MRVLKLKTVTSLGKDYANAKLPRVLHTRLTRLLISHFSRITQHYEIQRLLMSFRPQIDFSTFSLAPHSSFIFFIVLISTVNDFTRENRCYPRQIVSITYQSFLLKAYYLWDLLSTETCESLSTFNPFGDIDAIVRT